MVKSVRARFVNSPDDTDVLVLQIEGGKDSVSTLRLTESQDSS